MFEERGALGGSALAGVGAMTVSIGTPPPEAEEGDVDPSDISKSG